jgi:glycosyltransferase involved in cell wall biosynthesis
LESSSVSVQYLKEPLPGVSRARNRGLSSISDGIVAFIDDDEIADPFWLAEISRAFFEHPEADAVAGIWLPAELETNAQVWFEQYGGHYKHRGFVGAKFSPDTVKVQNPMYPLPPFGASGNMAFRRGSLREIGDFDTALGAGTPALGGEDMGVFTEFLLSGGTLVYQPTAITHHFHRRSKAELRHQMRAYGSGLTAFYTSLVMADPRRLTTLCRLMPKFLRESRGSSGLRSGGLTANFPSDLRWANRRGLLEGPSRYLVSRAVVRRQAHHIT